MKKFMLSALCAFVLVITSCGSDDDGGNCRDCEVLSIPISICDNGDGTATVTGAGQSETNPIPEGMTFEQFAETACSSSITIGQQDN